MIVAEQKRKTLAELAAEAQGDSRGLKCPKCHCHNFETVRTDPVDRAIARVRQCRNCGGRIHTTETIRAVVNQRSATGSN